MHQHGARMKKHLNMSTLNRIEQRIPGARLLYSVLTNEFGRGARANQAFWRWHAMDSDRRDYYITRLMMSHDDTVQGMRGVYEPHRVAIELTESRKIKWATHKH